MSLRSIAAAAVLSSALLAAAAAPVCAADFSADDRGAIEKIVREYLITHPEVLVEAMQALETRQQAATEVKTRAALKENRDEIFNDFASPVGGNPKGDVTVVEFFDYNCGYCKAVHNDALKLVKDDGRIRYVYKEFPILGPGSVTAAKAALAARAQGKYVEAHNALMGHRGRLDDSTILRLVGELGLNMDKLKADMESAAVTRTVEKNLALADKLGVRGTPAFVIGDALSPGAIKLDEMKRMVAEARKK